jgi:prepilin signal peptidase PulO-like enzyme (type II secretory pathway)
MKIDDHNKPLAKFTTMLIFTLISGFLVISTYDLIIQFRDKEYTNISDAYYWFIFVIISILMSFYLYKEEFKDLDRYNDYHRKYYIYFLLLVVGTLALTIWAGSISRERIFEKRKAEKASIRNGCGDNPCNNAMSYKDNGI